MLHVGKAALFAALLTGASSLVMHVRKGESKVKAQNGEEWVAKTLAQKRSWAPILKKCESETSSPSEQGLHEDFVEEAWTQGPYDQFSDFSTKEWEAIEADYASQPPLQTPPEFNFEAERIAGDASPFSPDMVTRGKCQKTFGSDAMNSHTCEFTNVYAHMGGLTAHILEGDKFPSGDLRVRLQGSGGGALLRDVVKIVRHKSAGELAAAIPAKRKEYTGVTLAFLPKWHFNIGHGLYDGLYPSFVSLIQWGKHADNFRVLLLGGHNPGNVEVKVPGAFARNEEVFGAIAGNGIVRAYELKEDSDKQEAHFDTVVVGCGLNGAKLDQNANVTLGAGRELGAAQLLREKVYSSFGVKPREETWFARRELTGIIVHNKRFGKDKPKWADEVMEQAESLGIKMQYVFWSKPFHDGHQNTGPHASQFGEQMKLMSRTDIHISAPGTAMMYQQFLPDGAVHINLGLNRKKPLPPQFWEEYMAEGTPYIKALYYWPKASINKHVAYDVESIMELVTEAKELGNNGFKIPVPVGSNLSPTSSLWKAYVHLTQDPHLVATGAPLAFMKPVNDAYAMRGLGNHFPEDVIFAAKHGAMVPNHCVLNKLMEDYGEPCPGCIWGQHQVESPKLAELPDSPSFLDLRSSELKECSQKVEALHLSSSSPECPTTESLAEQKACGDLCHRIGQTDKLLEVATRKGKDGYQPDTLRLQQVVANATMNGRKLKVVVYGTSVTAGAGCDPDAPSRKNTLPTNVAEGTVSDNLRWTDKLMYLADLYDSPVGVDMANFGKGGSHIFHASDIVNDLRNVPVDLIIVDYSVNDGGQRKSDGQNTQDFLALAKQLPNKPAILFLETLSANAVANLYANKNTVCSVQDEAPGDFPHWDILKREGIPSLSYADLACAAELHDPADFWPFNANAQQAHPSCAVHNTFAHLVLQYLNSIQNEACTASGGYANVLATGTQSASALTEMQQCISSPLTHYNAKKGFPAAGKPVGWKYEQDVAGKPGWISNAAQGLAEVGFDVELKSGTIILEFLSSYEKVGETTCWIEGEPESKQQINALWNMKASLSNTVVLQGAQEGKCRVARLRCSTKKAKFKILGLTAC